MSQENVEIVRNAFEVIYGSTSEPTATGASMRGDSKRAAELLYLNVEVHGTIGGLWEGRIARGLSEMLNSFVALRTSKLGKSVGLSRRGSFTSMISSSCSCTSTGAAEVAASKSRPIRRLSSRCARGGKDLIQPYMDQAAALEAAGLSE